MCLKKEKHHDVVVNNECQTPLFALVSGLGTVCRVVISMFYEEIKG